MSSTSHHEVQLPEKKACSVLWKMLTKTIQTFPAEFASFSLPVLGKFKKNHAHYICEFEIQRCLSKKRTEIAQFVLKEIAEQFVVASNGNKTSLASHLAQSSAFSLKWRSLCYPYFRPKQGYRLQLSYQHRKYQHRQEMMDLIELLRKQVLLSENAYQALHWCVGDAFSTTQQGYWNLQGEKFVLLGGNTPLAPLQFLLEAGATVLNLDSPPEQEQKKWLAQLGEFAGELYYIPEGVDFLQQPAEILATIQRFAGAQKFHLGCFAHSYQTSKQWQIAASISTIVDNVKHQLQSYFAYSSPLTITEVDKFTAETSHERNLSPQELASRVLYFLSRKKWYPANIVTREGRYWSQSLAPFQKCQEVAANLFATHYQAEVLDKTLPECRVSLNIAPLGTSSLRKKSLQAAFEEASKFSLHLWSERDIRKIMQALLFFDLFAKKSSGWQSKHVHGGVFTLPWSLPVVLKEATIVGACKRFLFLGRNNPESFPKLFSLTAGTWVIPDSPSELERSLLSLQGDLKEAFVGSPQTLAVSKMYLGWQNVVPAMATYLFFLKSLSNRYSLVRMLLPQRFFHSKKIYGTLLISLLWSQKSPQDSIVIEVDSQRQLTSIMLERANHQNLAFFYDSPSKLLQQWIYFGRVLDDGQSQLVISYRYDSAQGALYSSGPTQVNYDFLQAHQQIELADHHLSAENIQKFVELTKQPHHNSLTLLPNSGVLAHALEILKQQELQVDFTRVTVHRLCFFCPQPVPAWKPGVFQVKQEKIHLQATTKGEMLSATLQFLQQQQLVVSLEISLLIRGNVVSEQAQKIPRIEFQNPQQHSLCQKLLIKVMDERDLVEFASLNGDHNPLHQIDGVAQAVGFPGKINPGLGTLSEIEAAIKKAYPDREFCSLDGQFIRPAFPGREYQLYLFPTENSSSELYYQLVDNRHKVLVAGKVVFFS